MPFAGKKKPGWHNTLVALIATLALIATAGCGLLEGLPFFGGGTVDFSPPAGYEKAPVQIPPFLMDSDLDMTTYIGSGTADEALEAFRNKLIDEGWAEVTGEDEPDWDATVGLGGQDAGIEFRFAFFQKDDEVMLVQIIGSEEQVIINLLQGPEDAQLPEAEDDYDNGDEDTTLADELFKFNNLSAFVENFSKFHYSFGDDESKVHFYYELEGTEVINGTPATVIIYKWYEDENDPMLDAKYWLDEDYSAVQVMIDGQIIVEEYELEAYEALLNVIFTGFAFDSWQHTVLSEDDEFRISYNASIQNVFGYNVEVHEVVYDFTDSVYYSGIYEARFADFGDFQLTIYWRWEIDEGDVVLFEIEDMQRR